MIDGQICGVLVVSSETATLLELVPRAELCTKTPRCLARAGHDGPCIEVARTPCTAPDYGPRRSK